MAQHIRDPFPHRPSEELVHRAWIPFDRYVKVGADAGGCEQVGGPVDLS
jgi:hypothetical protein